MKDWSLARKLAFRFYFPFFILWTAIWNMMPLVDEWLYPFYYYPSFFVQNYLLKLWDIPKWEHSPTGSGDTLDDWILLLTYIVLSMIICFVWSILDKKRSNYSTLAAGLMIGLRYYLAFIMFGYGVQKLFLLQMPYPNLTQLYTPLGEFTPMRLTWMHIGYSNYYQFIGGCLETLGGLLILFRRTKIFGGLLLLAVMTQVALLNYFYGVPVKIFSTFLLIIIVYILKDDLLVIGKFMAGNPNQKIAIHTFYTTKKWISITRLFLKYGFLLYALGGSFYLIGQDYMQKKAAKNIELYGAYEVQAFIKNNDHSSATAYRDHWNYVVFGEGFQPQKSTTLIRQGFANYHRAVTTLSSTDSIKIALQGKSSIVFEGKFSKIKDSIELVGMMDKDTIFMKLIKDNHQLTLPNKKFKWIMEQSDF